MGDKMGNYTKTLPYELSLTSRVLNEAANIFFKENNFPITLDEFIILDFIFINPDIIQIQLAKLILKGRSHTGKLLKALEEKKCIIRIPKKQNSKVVMALEITPAGLKIYNDISLKLDKWTKDTDSNLKDKIYEVIDMLRSIRKSTEEKFNINFD